MVDLMHWIVTVLCGVVFYLNGHHTLTLILAAYLAMQLVGSALSHMGIGVPKSKFARLWLLPVYGGYRNRGVRLIVRLTYELLWWFSLVQCKVPAAGVGAARKGG
jgi:hypothetical protein